MTVSVAINALLGIILSVLYVVVVGYSWRYRRHWSIVIPIANALIMVIPTALYIQRAVRGDLTLRPLNWGVLFIVLPAMQVALLFWWLTRDAARGRAIATQAQVLTEDANQRAYKRTMREEKAEVERKELAAERTAAAQERSEAITERTAAATERLADAAEAETPKKDE